MPHGKERGMNGTWQRIFLISFISAYRGGMRIFLMHDRGISFPAAAGGRAAKLIKLFRFLTICGTIYQKTRGI